MRVLNRNSTEESFAIGSMVLNLPHSFKKRLDLKILGIKGRTSQDNMQNNYRY